MSQHHFSTTASSGQQVQVQCGWDRPLQHHHLTVWEAPQEPAGREVLYTCLVERGGGLPDVDAVADELEKLGIEAPEGLYERLWLDESFNQGNGLTQW